MKKQNSKMDIFDQIREESPEFRTELPKHAWSRITDKMDNSYSEKRFSFYKVFYNAAMVIFVMGLLFIIGFYLQKENSQQNASQNVYALNIEDLKSSEKTYPNYDVHKLHAAYKNLRSIMETELLSEPNNLQIINN